MRVRKRTLADRPALHSAPHAVLHAGPNGSGTESAKAWGALGQNWSLPHSGQTQPVWLLQRAPTWRTTPSQVPVKCYPDPHTCTG